MLIPPDKKDMNDESSTPVHRASSPPTNDHHSPYPSSRTIGRRSSLDPLLPPPYATSPPQPQPPPGPRQSTDRRFLAAAWRAVGLLFVAAAIGWLLAAPWMGRVGRHARPSRKSPAHDGDWDPEWDWTTPLLPNETSPRYCDIFTTHSSPSASASTWSTRTTLSLPLRGELYFHARGGYMSGHLEVSVGQLERNDTNSDDVLVLVEAASKNHRRVDGWHVCRTGDDRVAGVVLVTPDRLPGWHWDDLRFHVQVDYPAPPRSSQPIRLPSLSLDTVNMAIMTTDSTSYTFSSIDYRTTNAGITIDGLNASSLRCSTTNGSILAKRLSGLTTATLRTTNGGIECPDCCDPLFGRRPIAWDVWTSNGGVTGRFCATEQIGVTTSSGAIEGEFDAPLVRLATTNARVKAVVSGLSEGGADVSTTSGAVDVAFDIPDQSAAAVVPLKVITTNGYLSAHLVSLPRNVSLSARLGTSNAQLKWQGHPHYQGSFAFSTSPHGGGGGVGVSVDALSPLKGETKRDLAITDVVKRPWGDGSSFVRGTVARHGENKGDKGVAWGDIVGDTSNADVEAHV